MEYKHNITNMEIPSISDDPDPGGNNTIHPNEIDILSFLSANLKYLKKYGDARHSLLKEEDRLLEGGISEWDKEKILFGDSFGAGNG